MSGTKYLGPVISEALGGTLVGCTSLRLLGMVGAVHAAPEAPAKHHYEESQNLYILNAEQAQAPQPCIRDVKERSFALINREVSSCIGCGQPVIWLHSFSKSSSGLPVVLARAARSTQLCSNFPSLTFDPLRGRSTLPTRTSLRQMLPVWHRPNPLHQSWHLHCAAGVGSYWHESHGLDQNVVGSLLPRACAPRPASARTL